MFRVPVLRCSAVPGFTIALLLLGFPLFFKCLLPFPFDLNFGLRFKFLDFGFDLYFWTSIYIFGLRSIFLDFDLYFWTSIYIFGLRFIFFGNMI